MAETRAIRTARTARKTHYCGIRSTGCTRLIRPGDRYVITATPPEPALQGELAILSGTGWRQIRSCAGCVQALHGQTPDERATPRRPRRRRTQPARHVDPLDTVPCRRHVDEPCFDRPITTVHLPAANIA
ncbi:hypothetical protein AB0A95_30955 [Micromonospora sp. NPDC049230]|uniref:hypothetical protein n=1 Tax=Micromonospora sp. NPDC049230 TaxID=3155502 RepID=UPI0033F56072